MADSNNINPITTIVCVIVFFGFLVALDTNEGFATFVGFIIAGFLIFLFLANNP